MYLIINKWNSILNVTLYSIIILSLEVQMSVTVCLTIRNCSWSMGTYSRKRIYSSKLIY